MKNTDTLALGNFRGFKNPIGVKLAPITLFTGINGSGKSSFVSAIRLLRQLDISVEPNTLRLDSDRLQPYSFDLLKNRNSDNDEITIIHQSYHNILGENVDLILTLAKKTDYMAIVNSVRIRKGNNEDLLYLRFDDEAGDTSYVNLSYFMSKMRLWRGMIDKYGQYRDQILADEQLPGYQIIESFITFGSNQENDEKEKEDKAAADKLTKEYNELIKTEELTYQIRCSLKAYMCYDDPFIKRPADQLPEILDSYKFDEILFNLPLLNYLIETPKNEINGEWLKAIIKSRFPEYHNSHNRDEDHIDTVVDFLKANDYRAFEKKLVTDNIDRFIRLKWHGEEYIEKRTSSLIRDYIEYILESPKINEAIKSLSTKQIENGPICVSESPKNVGLFSRYVRLIYHEALTDFRNKFIGIEHAPLNQINPHRLLDVNHPLNQLISENRKTLTNNKFINKWLKEFGIGDELLIETPVEGLGYSIVIVENGVRKQLADEGSGIIHLIHLFINIGVFQEKGFTTLSPRTIILEEPETNMHPAWQSKLAEMFIDAHRIMKINFIIETHSEYIVRKLQNMVAKGEADRDDIVIIYFGKANPKDGSVERRKIEINPDGSLTKEFGSGFYDEADTLAFELMKLRHTQKN